MEEESPEEQRGCGIQRALPSPGSCLHTTSWQEHLSLFPELQFLSLQFNLHSETALRSQSLYSRLTISLSHGKYVIFLVVKVSFKEALYSFQTLL